MAEVLKGAIIGCGFFADRHGDIGLPMATVFELERGMGSDRSHTRTNPISVNYHACRSTKLWCPTSIRPAFCLARLIPFMPRPAAGTVTSSAKTRPSWCCRTGAPFMTGSMVHRFLDPDPDGPAMGGCVLRRRARHDFHPGHGRCLSKSGVGLEKQRHRRPPGETAFGQHSATSSLASRAAVRSSPEAASTSGLLLLLKQPTEA